MLAVCGIASVPELYSLLPAAVCRAPGARRRKLPVGVGVPEVKLGNGVLALFGILAVVELTANWDDTVRQIQEGSNFQLSTRIVARPF